MKNFISEFSRGRLFGHPVHIMLVHFPIAFFPMGALLDAASLYFKDSNLSLFSLYSISAGGITGWTALIFGAMDLFRISPDEKAFKNRNSPRRIESSVAFCIHNTGRNSIQHIPSY